MVEFATIVVALMLTYWKELLAAFLLAFWFAIRDT